MTYLLDSDVCIDLLRKRSRRLLARLESHDPSELRLSVVTQGELHYGALKSDEPSSNLASLRELTDMFLVLPLDGPCAQRYGEIRVQLEGRGTPIGPNDLFIAATALAHDLTLVTHNTREFSRVVGLRVEDWER